MGQTTQSVSQSRAMYFSPAQSQVGGVFYTILKDLCNRFALKVGMVVALGSQCCLLNIWQTEHV